MEYRPARGAGSNPVAELIRRESSRREEARTEATPWANPPFLTRLTQHPCRNGLDADVKMGPPGLEPGTYRL